ncbi:MAG: UvrD-helicase domain-containing protein, partial [Spirochaetaceae bacterium]|nr:UvrD-helicase domain-containing protein [Spirochaetaceae bacterium]
VHADRGGRGTPAHDPAHGTPVSASRRGSPAPPASRRTGAAGSTTEGALPHGADAGVRRDTAGAERALFLTCSAHLKRFSERIYRGLVKATELEHAPEAVRFATLGELLSEILGHAGRPEWQAPPAGLAEFGAILRNHPGAARYDTELVWEEIRSIIKGAKPPVSRRRFAQLAARFASGKAALRERVELAEYVVRLAHLESGARLDGVRARKTAFGSLEEFAACLRDTAALRRDELLFLLEAAARLLEKQSARLEQPLLTLREYEGLGRKRAPNFPFDRRDIHRLAEYYQARLQADARYDEIDQTRAALQYLERHGDWFRYDLVVCDEVQDFTDMQLALLFRLARDPRRTVLTGDPKQIINPSGFRWEEVRARYYERGLPVPPVINLSVNFRSVGNVVGLANEVLLLKRTLIGLAGGEITERWTFRGRPPLLVDGVAEPDLLETIRRGGAGQVVLVRTERERDRLRAALRSELVFTIGEAKGLEFDAVLLWRFPTALGSPAIWRRIAAGRVRGAADAPHVRHELNLLYVAVTRARNTLVIWDGEQVSPIWRIDALAGQVYRSADAAAIDNLWQRVSTPAEWRAQGDYFMEREHFAAAEECYRNAQAGTEEESARAHRLERDGELEAAARVFVRLGRVPRAAEGLERAGAFPAAAHMWRRAGNEMRAMA